MGVMEIDLRNIEMCYSYGSKRTESEGDSLRMKFCLRSHKSMTTVL